MFSLKHEKDFPEPDFVRKNDKLKLISERIPGILLALHNAEKEIQYLPLFVPCCGPDRHDPALQCIAQAIGDLQYCQEILEGVPDVESN